MIIKRFHAGKWPSGFIVTEIEVLNGSVVDRAWCSCSQLECETRLIICKPMKVLGGFKDKMRIAAMIWPSCREMDHFSSLVRSFQLSFSRSPGIRLM